jgi:hypothetical protein
VRICNDTGSLARFSVEWNRPGRHASVAHILKDGMPCAGFEVNDAGVRLPLELAAGNSLTLSLVNRNDHATFKSLGFRWNMNAFLRRRLSEVRDNYLSKAPGVLTLAKTAQRFF